MGKKSETANAAALINGDDLKRDKIIVKTSVVGIAFNVLLAAFKAFIGIVSNSIAIVLDAVNNLTDAASSVITIVGTKLSSRQPTKKHPFGFGRIEYLSTMIIGALVLYAGVTSFTQSIKKIIHPEKPDYSSPTLIIVAVAVVVKIALGLFVKSRGKQAKSDSLIASGSDALLDSVISAATLAAAGIYLIFHISLEAWLGVVISAVIIKSGIEILLDTLGKILGTRADMKLASEIKGTINGFPQVFGCYDLILNDYGPGRIQGSVHIEIPDTLTANKLDSLTREITKTVYLKHKVVLTAIGIYSFNTSSDKAAKLRDEIKEFVLSFDHVIQMHGFYLSEGENKISFDMIVDFDAKNRIDVYKKVFSAVSKKYPDYHFIIQLDDDYSVSD